MHYLNKLRHSQKNIKVFGKENIVCVDECGFSDRLRPFYGYSRTGIPLILKTNGGWKQYSLLMAIHFDGRIDHYIKPQDPLQR